MMKKTCTTAPTAPPTSPTVLCASDPTSPSMWLRIALTDGQLEVHLQPQVSLEDGRVVGAEALVRWNHPVRGLLSPAELLPAADQEDLLASPDDAAYADHRPVGGA